jgi:hypothetical protein
MRNDRGARDVVVPLACLWGLLAVSGCSGHVKHEERDTSQENLTKIYQAYSMAVQTTKRPPQSEEDMRALLKQGGGDPDVLLRSPRDGQPYVIIWGVRLDALDIASTEESPVVLAHEQTGVSGKRYVLRVEGSNELLTEDQFAKARFPKGQKRPPGG